MLWVALQKSWRLSQALGEAFPHVKACKAYRLNSSDEDVKFGCKYFFCTKRMVDTKECTDFSFPMMQMSFPLPLRCNFPSFSLWRRWRRFPRFRRNTPSRRHTPSWRRRPGTTALPRSNIISDISTRIKRENTL